VSGDGTALKVSTTAGSRLATEEIATSTRLALANTGNARESAAVVGVTERCSWFDGDVGARMPPRCPGVGLVPRVEGAVGAGRANGDGDAVRRDPGGGGHHVLSCGDGTNAPVVVVVVVVVVVGVMVSTIVITIEFK
jgi:hypothetical protein